jgi:ectoine hydroxylase-related dioxygenase (phytanoyl-CoA dioxygenase family)
MGRTVQGVLNLYDNAEEDGGFQCVPGMFGPPLQQWVADHPGLPSAEPNGKYELKGFGYDTQMGSRAVRVPSPAGTLILFDATLPHGTKPNVSSNSRAIMFLRYITSDELPVSAWRDRNAALRRVVEEVGFRPTDEQTKHLYGPE